MDTRTSSKGYLCSRSLTFSYSDPNFNPIIMDISVGLNNLYFSFHSSYSQDLAWLITGFKYIMAIFCSMTQSYQHVSMTNLFLIINIRNWTLWIFLAWRSAGTLYFCIKLICSLLFELFFPVFSERWCPLTNISIFVPTRQISTTINKRTLERRLLIRQLWWQQCCSLLMSNQSLMF